MFSVLVSAESEEDVNQTDLGVTRNKIMTAQYECYQKIMQDPIQQAEGLYCNRTWDGWLCWNDVAAGTESMQYCPDYFQDFDPSEKVTKICDQDGHWFRHPDSNRTWTNYTLCNNSTHEKVKTALNLFYLTIIGHGLSIASLIISLIIFFYFKSLSCQRITLHKNLFFSFVCNSIVTIIHLTAVANNQALVATNPLQRFPLLPACIHAIARSLYYNDKVNLFFLLNIVRVLITKLKVTHQAESNLYMKAVRATLILVPLLGIEFVLFPWRPEGRVAEEVYDYVMHILMHYQGLLVSTIFCFFNGEVQAILRRNWNQYKIQFGNGFAHSDALRSASYTVSTISDMQGYSHDCPTEHLNGKSIQDIEHVALKPEKMYDLVM
ncbi:Calcitonin gene-related peptide type 1 receptor [Apodemus speciosus]|uniref:Calcitonin gene-related peptide type 1 receptor n=1 Tax=Apodemus speciosus TaxID=105296 RepID=A0ABQ0EHE3_APOSI